MEYTECPVKPATLSKNNLTQVFSGEFWQIFHNTVLIENIQATSSEYISLVWSGLVWSVW